jgi:hypothetical protein
MVKMPDSELWQTADPDGITRAAVSALLHWHKALSALRPGKWKPCQPAG